MSYYPLLQLKNLVWPSTQNMHECPLEAKVSSLLKYHFIGTKILCEIFIPTMWYLVRVIDVTNTLTVI